MSFEIYGNDTRSMLLQRLGKALETNVMYESTAFPNPELSWDQANLLRALHKMAHKRADLLVSLLGKVHNHFTLSHDKVRAWLKLLCTQAQSRYALALFDSQTGHMRHMARSYQGTIRSYISYLLAFDEHDEINDLLDNEFVTCDDCGEWDARDETTEPYNSSATVCRSCIENYYTYSDYYDSYVYNENSSTAIDRDGSEITIHCDDEDFAWSDDEDCYVHHEYSGRIIGNYHSSKGKFIPIQSEWTKTNSFYVTKPLNLSDESIRFERFFGVELEVEVRNDRSQHAEELNAVLNDGKVGHRCFFESDGSLSNGFEIITQPMGLDMHESFWEWVKRPHLLRGLSSHNTSTCGLHVHVTRAGLSKLQLSKMVAFVNHPDNRALIEAIARRYGSEYARYYSSKRVGNALRGDTNRYEALNIESRKTVEFRMFKGSLKYESIISAVQFANALVNFCSDQSGYGFKLDTKSFLQFLASPVIANDTKILRNYIDNKLETL